MSSVNNIRKVTLTLYVFTLVDVIFSVNYSPGTDRWVVAKYTCLDPFCMVLPQGGVGSGRRKEPCRS